MGAYSNKTHSLRRTLALKSAKEISKEWQKMVSEFSGLALTFSSDRLAALAGLAAKLQALRKGTYISGAWTDSVAFDLAWYSNSVHSKRSDCVAPSWSWASLDSKVFFLPLEELRSYAIEEQATLATIVTDQTTIPASVQAMALSSQFIESQAQRSSQALYQFQIDTKPLEKCMNRRSYLGSHTIHFYPDTSETMHDLPCPVFFFRLLALHRGERWLYAYLVLQESIETEEQRFKRIGLCVLRFDNQPEHLLRDLGVEKSIVLI
ncbi:MAG: hypothetical protein Q9165_001917 [Trypethelium subeluteriae]